MQSTFIRLLSEARNASQYARELQGRTLGSQRGKVVDVDDPLGLGRVKVILDSREDAESGTAFASSWFPVIGSFTGRQPKSLLGQRVNIDFSDGSPMKGVIQDIIFDELSTVSAKASTMVRLPIYEKGELPSPSEDNRGCLALLIDDEYGDYLVVCLKRNGEYLWERQSALIHTHSGATDQPQPDDSDGDSQEKVDNRDIVVFDEVKPTSDSPIQSSLSIAN